MDVRCSHKWRVPIGAILLMLAGQSCSSNDNSPQTDGQPRLVDAGGARLPFETVTDWVSYGDAALVVTVTGESQIQASPAETERGEGLVGRQVKVSVDSIVWQHAATNAPPSAFDFIGWGWTLHDGETTPMGAPRPEVGSQYLIMATEYADDGWGPINPATVLPLANGKVQNDSEETFEAIDAVVGLDVNAVAALLAGTPPEPIAEANRNLDPDARVRAVHGSPDSSPVTTTAHS